MGTRVPARRTKPRAKKKPAPAAKGKRSALPGNFALSSCPPESTIQAEKSLCVACIWDVFTRHMGLPQKTALSEIQNYTPSLEELKAPEAARPFVAAKSVNCPYCAAPSKWLARLSTIRIESGKATDALRRELVKSLPKSKDQFVVLEEKATQQLAFFEWLEKISQELDLDSPNWLREASRHYLYRNDPKVDWQAQFAQTHSIRRSRRLESGSEVDSDRLFLAPVLFDELLLVQYLLSRSHQAGGLTLEGRYTLPELFRRLRNAGYLRAVGVEAHNPSDAIEKLVAYLSGGEASLRFYYIVDRRELLEIAKVLKTSKPKPRRASVR